jgi:glycosyltransferase involved in cell wall biosynthesis
MRITIVNGFFFPVPPLAGGSTEKSWFQLGREFAARGHQVVSLSRRWPGLPDRDVVAGVQHVRLPGHDHHHARWQNLLQDLRWSIRVHRALPPADIVICNVLTLPLWLRRIRPQAGRVVVLTGRMPKGQYRWYGGVDRVFAVSSAVRRRVLAENPRLLPVVRNLGYPIAWSELSRPRAALPDGSPLTIGFVGRLHREKGLDLLVAALALLARRPLPAWRVQLCGPGDVARGGSGDDYVRALETKLAAFLPRERFTVQPPVFDDAGLADVYRGIDLFCYPSLAEQGETFGVAVAEAMAAGAVPIVSRLECFSDFVEAGVNGMVFDHRHPDAAMSLANDLSALLTDPARRATLATAAQRTVQRYDLPEFATRLLEDFSTLS